jgi:hypothetical protein
MDRILRNLNATKTINDSIPVLIDIFTTFYGEDLRDEITEKFRNMKVIGYYDSDSLASMIIKLQKNLSDSLVKELFKEMGMEYSEEEAERYMGSSTFRFPNLLPILSAYEYIDMVKRGHDALQEDERKRKYETIKKYMPDLDYDTYINDRLTEEQMKKLPSFIRLGREYWFGDSNIDDKLANARKMSINAINSLFPGASEANVDMLITSGQLDRLHTIGKKFKEYVGKYNAIDNEVVDKYSRINTKIHEYESSLKRKYFFAFLEETKEYLSISDQKLVDEMIAKDSLLGSSNIQGLDIVLSNYLLGIRNINYFDQSSETDLQNPEVSDYRRETIKENRIKYFKYKGIDLGNNYEDYVNNPECKKVWPSDEMISKINERLDYYSDRFYVDMISSMDFFKEVGKTIEEKGLLDTDGVNDVTLLAQKTTYIETNLFREGDTYKLFPFLFVHAHDDIYADKNLLHELNHIFELALRKVDDNSYDYICGWDTGACSMNQSSAKVTSSVGEERKLRGYESFNEIINEFIAQRMAKMMHDAGVFILNDENHFMDRGGTSYEYSAFLVRDFFNDFFDSIIMSRRNGNIQVIWDRVGKENFDALNDLFHDFNEVFTQRVYGRLQGDLKANRDTVLVRTYNEMKARRDAILKAMKEYEKTSQVTL